jgi:hypothetical protein
MTAPPRYRACPTRRGRRSKADIDDIKKAIVDVIQDDPPMTVRQVFYQLVTRGVIEKTEAQYQGTVIRLMTDMRIGGELRWDWIVDESRRRRITQTYNSVVEALEETARFYRRSALKAAPDYIELWCEKDALSAVLWEITSEYDVPLMVSRGMPSLTFLYGTATWIRDAARRGKPTYIYQFGDWDPSGVLSLDPSRRGWRRCVRSLTASRRWSRGSRSPRSTLPNTTSRPGQRSAWAIPTPMNSRATVSNLML